MSANLNFDASQYSPQTLQLILAKAQEWVCTPQEAVARLLDELAKKHARQAA